MDLSNIRNNYKLKSLSSKTVVESPLDQLEKWIEEAKESACLEFSAMTIATANTDGQPSVRTVLLKFINEEGLYFFTNYKSRKGKDLALNHKIAAHFFWPELERQVKIEGTAQKVTAEISDLYFKSRPMESQISAVISQQSTEVPNREYLEKMWKAEVIKWKEKEIERPEFWGGFLIKPNRVEFWQGRPNRLHDRILFKKSPDGWKIGRLAP